MVMASPLDFSAGKLPHRRCGANGGECPDSEVRRHSRRPPSELRNRKDTSQLYDSSAAFEPGVRTRTRREGCANFGFAALEHIPFLRNRDVLQIHALAHVLVGEPVSTSPGHAL